MSEADVNVGASDLAQIEQPLPVADVDALPAKIEREGLPRGYRMRADAHYVEQMAFASAGQPVRLIPTSEIDAIEPFGRPGAEHLIESIRIHGVVHPLLVRRHGSR